MSYFFFLSKQAVGYVLYLLGTAVGLLWFAILLDVT